MYSGVVIGRRLRVTANVQSRFEIPPTRCLTINEIRSRNRVVAPAHNEEVVLGNDGTPPDLSQLFDYSKSAGYFSQLAGVLAGFAFLAITLLLNRQHRRGTDADVAQEHQQDVQIVATLGCALLGLVAAAAMYALLAGEQGWSLTSGRGLSRFVLAGLAFVFSVYTAFSAAVQLVSAAALGAHLRFMVAVLAPPAVVAFFVTAIDDVAANPPNQRPTPGEPFGPGWNPGRAELWAFAHHGTTWSIPIVFVLCAVIWCAGLRWRHATGGVGHLASALRSVVSVGLTYLPYLSLTLVAWTVWRTAVLSRMEPGARIDSGHALWLTGICVVILVLQSACLSLIWGGDARPDFHREADSLRADPDSGSGDGSVDS